MPLGLRINLQEISQLIGEGGRRDRRRENADARALQRLLCGKGSVKRSQKRLPGLLIAHRHHALRAVGIVQAENVGLRKNVRPAERCRMLVVALNLCRTSEVALDQQRAGVSAKRHRRGVELGPAGNHILGLAHVGNDGFERQAHAAGHAGQRHGCAHHLQEAATRDGIDPFGSALGKLAVQSFLESGTPGKLFEAAPVLRAGLFGSIVHNGCLDSFADGVQVQFALLRGANIFALSATVLFFHLHRVHITLLEAVIPSGGRVREAKSRAVEGSL